MIKDDRHDYFPRNRRLAALLVGRTVRTAVRLLDAEPEDEPRVEWGPALLESHDGLTWLFDIDEAKSNVLLFEVSSETPILNDNLMCYDIRPSIISASDDDPLGFLLTEPIARVELIARPSDPEHSHFSEMCGLRLTGASSGRQVCIGTHLTSLMVPGVWFLLPEEVDSVLRYELLLAP